MQNKLNTKPFFIRSERVKDHLPTKSLNNEEFKKLKDRAEDIKKTSAELFDDKFYYGKVKKNSKVKAFIYTPPENLGIIIAEKFKDIKECKDKCLLCNSTYTIFVKDKETKIAINSTNLIFDFGTGDELPSFRDKRTKGNITLCFMCDFFYKISLLYNYFLNNKVILLDTPYLLLSLKLKERVFIQNEYLPNSKLPKSKTNIPNVKLLGNYSVLIDLLYLLFKNSDRGLMDELIGNNLISFDVNRDGVDNVIVYNKLAYIFALFQKLEGIDTSNKEPFIYKLIYYHDEYKNKKSRYLIREEFCKDVLNKMYVYHTIFIMSFYNLSNLDKDEKMRFNTLNIKQLSDFFIKYLEVIKMEGNYKKFHEICKFIGLNIGEFASDKDKKDLLYKIREVNNQERLVEFFREFIYDAEKEDAGYVLHKKIEESGKKYMDLIDELLGLVNSNRDVTFIRDIIGIYSVQNFLSKQYAKKMRGGNQNE